jgi:hypothetical protein
MREITDHKTNAANGELHLFAADDPGDGGANHHYLIGKDVAPSGSMPAGGMFSMAEIVFQNGPIGEVGVNGLTHEVLLAIIIDRLRAFQSGPYAGNENRIALDHCEMALAFLHMRTVKRRNRGVEGTHQP